MNLLIEVSNFLYKWMFVILLANIIIGLINRNVPSVCGWVAATSYWMAYKRESQRLEAAKVLLNQAEQIVKKV